MNSMRRFFIAGLLMFSISVAADAQKIAYLDTEQIFASVPEYAGVQERIQILADGYRAKIDEDVKKLEQLYNSYMSRKSALSQSDCEKIEEELSTREQAVRDRQMTYFGEGGAMEKASAELMAPVQAKVDAVIAKLSESGEYIMIVDISSMQGILYKNPEFDLTKQAIELLNNN